MSAAILALISGNILAIVTGIWCGSRWTTRIEARLIWLERKNNGLYDPPR